MKNRILVLVVVGTLSLVVSTWCFWACEHGANPEQIRTVWDAPWWWVVTAATVGYGDIVPHTPGGRLVAVFMIASGFFIFASGIAIIAESIHELVERRARGTARLIRNRFSGGAGTRPPRPA